MKTRSPEREKAYKLYIKSNKTARNKEIAEKLGVSASLVAKWKSQDKWNSEDLPKEKVKSKSNGKTKGGKPGAPYGNCNAFANRGGPPLGNTNSLKHGGYSRIYFDSLTEEEKELADDMPKDEETLLIDQIKLYSVRERRIMLAIQKVKDEENENLVSGIRETATRSDFGSNSSTQIVKSKNYENKRSIIARLEDELTRVQRAKNQCIDSLFKLRIENQKLDLLKESSSEIEDTEEMDTLIYGKDDLPKEENDTV